MTQSERTAVVIALDELDSYIGVVGDEEDSIEKLRWASRKLHELVRADD